MPVTAGLCADKNILRSKIMTSAGPYKMEPTMGNKGDLLYDLLSMARNYRPNDNIDYFAPVDAAMAAVLGSPLVADRLLGLALKTRCILNFKKDEYYVQRIGLSRDWENVTRISSDRRLSEEGRQVAWVPSQEDAASSRWRLRMTDPGNASVVSKDLMWLMLQCHKITGLPMNPLPLYGRAIMEYFTVSVVKDYLDPIEVLPGQDGQWEDYNGIAIALKEGRYRSKAHNVLVAAISNDSWWELYLQLLKNAGRGAVVVNMLGYSDAKWFEIIVSQLSKEHELRVLDLADYMGDYRGLACACAHSSGGPLLRAALARPDQKYAVDKYLLKSILFRKDIDQDCESALIEYLGRCEKTELLCAVVDYLESRYGTDVAMRRLSAAAARVLIGACRGLEITLRAYEYIDSLYISSLLIYSTVSLHAPITEFAYTLSRTHKKVTEELKQATETLLAAEIYVAREDAIQAVIDKLLAVCPRDQKELSRVLLWMMLRGADGRELLLAYVGHVSMASKVRIAAADKCVMVLFGLCFRPWLYGEERIG